jgi:endo-1,4-beta-xylanase
MRRHPAILLVCSVLAACGSASTSDPGPSGPTLRSLAEGRILIGTAAALSPLQSDPAYAARLTEQYDLVTPENAMKFDQVEPSRGSFTFTSADAIVSFAQAHDMVVRGHCLLWQWQSAWLWNNGNLQPAIAAADLPTILHDHVDTVVRHFKGKVAYWDVVNEALGNTDSTGTLSVENSLANNAWTKYYPLATGEKKYKWIEDAFNIAHAADPDAKLFYNEVGDEGLNGWNYRGKYTYALVQQLLADGVPIHGVGMQMHIDTNGYPLNDNFAAEVKRFTDLGLEVHITEMDVRLLLPAGDAMLAAQKATYKSILTAALANPKVTALVTWGLDDGHSWIPGSGIYPGYGAALPFDDAYNAKPAYYGLLEALQAP